MTQPLKTVGVNYSYLQRSGKYAKRHSICAAEDLQTVLAKLQKDKNIKNITVVA